jgi:hypothetical protein
MTPYIVGQHVSAKPFAPVDSKTTSIRAEDSGKPAALRVLDWSAATFGAEAILGWFAGTRSGNR